MSKSAHKNIEPRFLFIYLIILITLFLTATNITSYLSPKLVLGIETEMETAEAEASDDAFWYEFLSKNPEYIPGWIEIGREDRAKEIDPNYQQR